MTAELRAKIIAEARARFGLPYGLPPGPGQTDCSKYVKDVYEAAGLAFSPHVRTAEQERADSVPIDWDDVKPGDLLFFEDTYDITEPSRVGDGHVASHIGISLGAGTRRMLDANDGRGTSGETNIGTDYWQEHLFEARRHPALVGGGARPEQPWGVDVASHQGTVDWAAVRRAGAAFGFTKATGGTWYRNPTFAPNWLGMKAAGLKRGAYHFAFESSGQPPPGDGPEAEADYFLAEIGRGGGIGAGDMLVLDLEDGAGQLGWWALAWCRRVEERSGVRPLVYTGAWFSGPHGLGSAPELAAYPLWLAAYQERMPAPPAPWQTVAFWQHTDKATVPGVRGPCDRNLFNGPTEHLALYGKPGGTVRPVEPADPRDAELAALKARVGGLETALAQRTAERDSLIEGLAVAADNHGDTIQQALDAIRKIRAERVGPRP